jgi:hypothetical protein
MTWRRLTVPAVLFAGAATFAASPVGAQSLFNIRLGNGPAHLAQGGQAVKVPLLIQCPNDPSDTNAVVVVDVTVSQTDKLNQDIGGEAESVPVTCNNKFKSITVTVLRDPAESTGNSFVKGPASVKAVLDASMPGSPPGDGVDVAQLQGGKDGSTFLQIV